MASTTETVALYERILTLIPIDALQNCYNDFFKDEISTLDRAVTDVSTAFSKLQEIRDAVDKLSTGGGSSSLMQVMDSTIKLQQELDRKLELVVAGMTKEDNLPCIKRKRYDGSGDITRSEEKPVGVVEKKVEELEKLETEVTVEIELPLKKKRKRKKKPNDMNGKVESPESTSEQVSALASGDQKTTSSSPLQKTITTIMDANQGDLKTPETEATGLILNPVNYKKVLFEVAEWGVDQREKFMPELLLKLAKVVAEVSSSELQQNGPKIIKLVAVWAMRCGAKRGLLEAFSSFIEAVDKPIKKLPNHSRTVGVLRLYSRLQGFVRDLQRRENSNARASGETPTDYDILLWEANITKRQESMPQVILALKTEMSRRVVALGHERGVARAVNSLAFWAHHEARDSKLNQLYLELAQTVKSYAAKILNFVIKAELIRNARRMELAIGRLAIWTIRERVNQVLNLVNKLECTSPLDYLDTAILMVDEVIHFEEPGWNPRKNLAVRECYSHLKALIESLPEGSARQQRLTVLKKWGMDESQLE